MLFERTTGGRLRHVLTLNAKKCRVIVVEPALLDRRCSTSERNEAAPHKTLRKPWQQELPSVQRTGVDDGERKTGAKCPCLWK